MIKKISAWAMCLLVGNRSAKGIKISKQLRYYKELKEFQWDSLEENVRLQKERLYNIVKFALEEVPYYKELGIDSSNLGIETIYEDIKQLPILTKDIIRKEGKRLRPQNGIADWTFLTTSGGTTGEPVEVCHSGYFFDYGQAQKLLYDEWSGRKIGDSQVRLWGSERDILSGKKDWMNKIYRWCRNEMFLNSFKMSDEIMSEYVVQINKKRPKMILAYVQSARELAQFIEKNDLEVWSPNGIMTSAGNLDNKTYELLSRVFKCPIINRYGSREMGDMACSCEKNEGLHIAMPVCHIEILNENGEVCQTGENGNVIVSLLTDYSMPLIRYQIGDRGFLTSEKCSCGRGWSLLGGIVGRTVDVFKTEDGGLVDGEFFTHLFYDEKNVKQFQIVQDKINHVIIKLVFYDKENIRPDFYTDLEHSFKVVLGEKVEFSYENVDYIPVGKSGKRAYTISMI